MTRKTRKKKCETKQSVVEAKRARSLTLPAEPPKPPEEPPATLSKFLVRYGITVSLTHLGRGRIAGADLYRARFHMDGRVAFSVYPVSTGSEPIKTRAFRAWYQDNGIDDAKRREFLGPEAYAMLCRCRGVVPSTTSATPTTPAENSPAVNASFAIMAADD